MPSAMTDSVANFLRRVPLLSSLPDEKLSALARRLRTQRYKEQQEILSADDHTTDVFFVFSGRVEVRNYSENGREFVYSVIGKGEVFGEFAAIDGRPRAASVVALEESLVCRMSSAEFLSVLSSNFDTALKLMRLLITSCARSRTVSLSLSPSAPAIGCWASWLALRIRESSVDQP
jgi:CRP-like cAMP-binding protein